MKKARNIGLILGLIILISSNSNAQYYYTSYGYAQDWRLPQQVQYSIYDNYYGYEVAHVQRYNRHGHRNYNVLLHRNGWFVELRYDRFGHIYKTVRHKHHYPLAYHNCTNHCGYHRAYYTNYYPKYHNHHNGYKTTVYVNTHHGHKNYYNHGHSKKKYYTNIHTQKQHKSHYNGNIQGNKKSQQNYNKSTNNQQLRTNNVIRKPQQTNTRTVEHKRPQSSRSQHLNGQKAPTRNRNTETARNLMTYKNGRGSRDR